MLHQMTLPPPSPDLNPIEMVGGVGPQSEGKAANNCSAYVGTHSRLLEKHSHEVECAKLSSRQRVATLKILQSKIFVDFLVTT